MFSASMTTDRATTNQRIKRPPRLAFIHQNGKWVKTPSSSSRMAVLSPLPDAWAPAVAPSLETPTFRVTHHHSAASAGLHNHRSRPCYLELPDKSPCETEYGSTETTEATQSAKSSIKTPSSYPATPILSSDPPLIKHRISGGDGHLKELRTADGHVAMTLNYLPGYILGRGQFGIVKRVQIEGKTYARKILARRRSEESESTILKQAKKEFYAYVAFQDSPYFLHPVTFYSSANNHVLIFEEAQVLNTHVEALKTRLTRSEFIKALLPLSIQFLEAIQLMHDRGIVHRDIKLQNIFLGADGLIKIGDLGTIESEADQDGKSLVGSPHYMAPEVTASQKHTRQSEAFACGATLCQMFVGTTPIQLITPCTPSKESAVAAMNQWQTLYYLSTGYARDYDTFLESFPATATSPITKIILDLIHPDPEHRLSIPEALARLRAIEL